jgi:UDP-N-acetylmuramate dehydrogenase
MEIQQNIPLSPYTTLNIGGLARFFVEVATSDELKEAIKYATDNNLEYYIIAGGSDLLISDKGYAGLVIRYVESGVTRDENKVTVKPGTVLQELVDALNEAGLAGCEKLAGIPGTVGGAIYGNAGAYGATISDHLTRVKVYDGDRERWMDRDECLFDYRQSAFKDQKHLIILEAEFEFIPSNPEELKKISLDTIEARSKKYPPGIKCPGSFFKNLLLINLPKEIVDIAPKDYYGKLPSAWLLDQVGARGSSKGEIKIADYHANLFMNTGNGTAQDFFELASEWKAKVKEKYHVELEPEVQLIGFDREL